MKLRFVSCRAFQIEGLQSTRKSPAASKAAANNNGTQRDAKEHWSGAGGQR